MQYLGITEHIKVMYTTFVQKKDNIYIQDFENMSSKVSLKIKTRHSKPICYDYFYHKRRIFLNSVYAVLASSQRLKHIIICHFTNTV